MSSVTFCAWTLTSPIFVRKIDALNADDVAEVEVLELPVGLLADIVAADVDLDLAVAVEHVGEAGLAHHAARHHAAGDGDGLAVQRLEVVQYLFGAMGLVVAGKAVGVAALGLQSAQLFQADAVLFGYFLSEFLGHGGIPPSFFFGQRRVISSTFSFSAPPGVLGLDHVAHVRADQRLADGRFAGDKGAWPGRPR